MKIVTLNCANYDDHPYWEERKKMIVDEIYRLDPDVVLLQEIRFDPSKPPTNSDYLNMSEQIVVDLTQQKVDVEGFFSKAQYYAPITYQPESYPTSISEGLAILAKAKTSTQNKISTLYLPLTPKSQGNEDQNRRITQHIEWVDPTHAETTINIFNTHFSYDPNENVSNIEFTLSYAENYCNQIFAGDMNAVPNNISRLFEEKNLVDLWTHMHNEDPGYTFPSNNPIKRIDYFWISKDLLDNCTNITIERILSIPNGNGVYASDHLGLFVEFL